MKRQLLALGLVATSMGFADTNGQMNATQTQSTSCSTCGCTSCCCNSPTPDCKIDCTCFVPQWYNMSCDCGFFITADFLYWYGREDNLSYAMRGQTIQSGTNITNDAPLFLFINNKLEYLGDRWDPGVRVGLGWNDSCDGWDLYLYWTYYHNKKKNSTSVDSFVPQYPTEDGFALVNPWTTNAVIQNRVFWEKVSASWRFTINSVDLELGKRYWLSKCFTLRPYTALRGAWSHTKFSTTNTRDGFDTTVSTPTSGAIIDTTARLKYRNTFWGVGMVGGLQPSWYFTPCFSIYANADMALLWGRRGMKRKDSQVLARTSKSTDLLSGNQVDYHYKSKKSSFSMMQPILDVGLGIRWENYYCDNQFHLEIDLGWEHHELFHHNYRFQYDYSVLNSVLINEDGNEAFGFDAYDETVHNVAFGGLVVRIRFDF